MKIPYYEVHSFAERIGGGNPAGVCVLDAWLQETDMQKIAAENNLSETAFVVKDADGFRLRWFAPKAEVDLCGHATLAAAYVLYSERGITDSSIKFFTRSGILNVARRGTEFTLEFPVLDIQPCEAPADLVAGLGRTPLAVYRSMDYVAVFGSEEEIAALTPDLDYLKKLDLRAVVVTAPGKDVDYVCRCFGPKIGIPEDPVTGSAQCELVPYWAQQKNQKRFSVIQRSSRGGRLTCELKGEQVFISGSTVLYLKGELFL